MFCFFSGQRWYRVIAHYRRATGASLPTWDAMKCTTSPTNLAALFEKLDRKARSCWVTRPVVAKSRLLAGPPRLEFVLPKRRDQPCALHSENRKKSDLPAPGLSLNSSGQSLAATGSVYKDITLCRFTYTPSGGRRFSRASGSIWVVPGGWLGMNRINELHQAFSEPISPKTLKKIDIPVL